MLLIYSNLKVMLFKTRRKRVLFICPLRLTLDSILFSGCHKVYMYGSVFSQIYCVGKMLKQEICTQLMIILFKRHLFEFYLESHFTNLNISSRYSKGFCTLFRISLIFKFCRLIIIPILVSIFIKH